MSKKDEPKRERIPLNDVQKRMLDEADQAVRDAQRTLTLILSTICAGQGIADASLVGIEDGALVVEVK